MYMMSEPQYSSLCAQALPGIITGVFVALISILLSEAVSALLTRRRLQRRARSVANGITKETILNINTAQDLGKNAKDYRSNPAASNNLHSHKGFALSKESCLLIANDPALSEEFGPEIFETALSLLNAIDKAHSLYPLFAKNVQPHVASPNLEIIKAFAETCQDVDKFSRDLLDALRERYPNNKRDILPPRRENDPK